MLVLSRYRDESIYIGDDIVITVVDIRGDRVRIGVQAPSDVTVHRQEVYEAIKHGIRETRTEVRNAESLSAPSSVSAPLGQELSKKKAKMAVEAKALPVGIEPSVDFGTLTAEIVPQ